MRKLLCLLGKHEWAGANGLPYDPQRDGTKMTCRHCDRIRVFCVVDRRWITTTVEELYAIESLRRTAR